MPIKKSILHCSTVKYLQRKQEGVAKFEIPKFAWFKKMNPKFDYPVILLILGLRASGRLEEAPLSKPANLPSTGLGFQILRPRSDDTRTPRNLARNGRQWGRECKKRWNGVCKETIRNESEFWLHETIRNESEFGLHETEMVPGKKPSEKKPSEKRANFVSLVILICLRDLRPLLGLFGLDHFC